MAAPKGNRFWEARSSHGRKPKFASPEILQKACLEYFEWVEENPLWETKVFHAQGEITKTEVPKMRAMTIIGLCNFLDMTVEAWANYRKKKGFLVVITRIESAIRQQKFEGASAEFLNPNIIARDLGLRDKQDYTVGGSIDHKHTVEQISETDSWIESIIGSGKETEDQTPRTH